MNLDHLIESLRDLPEPIIEQVQDYVDFLKTKHQPVTKAAEDRFWQLIDLLDWEAKTASLLVQPLVKKLTSLSEDLIFEYQDQLAKHLHELDGPDYLEAFAKSGSGASADSFLYGRCFVIGNGRAFFEWVLENPDNFPPGDVLEELIGCEKQAYLDKTGKKMIRVPETSIETGHNVEKWGEQAISYA